MTGIDNVSGDFDVRKTMVGTDVGGEFDVCKTMVDIDDVSGEFVRVVGTDDVGGEFDVRKTTVGTDDVVSFYRPQWNNGNRLFWDERE